MPAAEVSGQGKLLAHALHEMRLLLSSCPGNDGAPPAVRAAAHLPHALHNQALGRIHGRNFDLTAAQNRMATLDDMLGENFMRQYRELVEKSRAA